MTKKKPKLDNRMAWVRNLDSLKESEEGSTWYEIEFASECLISGTLYYADGKVTCHPFTMNPNKDGLIKYIMRIQYTKIIWDINDTTSKNGYYFNGGPVEELLTLFSLFFQSRIYRIADFLEIQGSGRLKTEWDFSYERCNKLIHPAIFDNKPRKFSDLQKFLDDVRNLPEEKHARFIKASWHYSSALKEVGHNSEMVYIRLVSAIEVLSQYHELKRSDDSLLGKKFDELFHGVNLTPNQSSQLREALDVDNNGIIIYRNLKVKEKFIKFINSYCDKNSFKDEHSNIYVNTYEYTNKEGYTPRNMGNLDHVLKNIYIARSQYLHNGEPMHLSRFIKIPNDWHFDGSIGGIKDNRDTGEPLPYPYWFENLTRTCLMSFLENHK